MARVQRAYPTLMVSTREPARNRPPTLNGPPLSGSNVNLSNPMAAYQYVINPSVAALQSGIGLPEYADPRLGG